MSRKRRLCIVCHKRPPEVPDRSAAGKPVKRVCLECHGKRLADDLRRIAEARVDIRDEGLPAKA